MVRKIVESVSDEVLQQDLEKYRQRALELGATDAKIITTDMVVIDERVRAKCIYPKCEWYGTSVNCPPHTIDVEQTRKIVDKFRYAIFFRLKVPTEIVAGKRTPEQLKENRRLRNTKAEIEAYAATAEPYDKAGGYAIQGRAAGFVDRIEGSYLNVVGLPAVTLLGLLERAGARL